MRPPHLDRESCSKFSLLNLFELVFAYGLILAVDRFTHQVLGWPDRFILIMSFLYPLKIALSVYGRRDPAVAIAAYVYIGILAVLWPAYQLSKEIQITPFGWCFWFPMTWLTVPSVSFCRDMWTSRLPSIRFLVWRSVAEIIVIYPVWLYVAAFIGLLFGAWWI
jgi:hypothetical protein